MIPAPAYKYLPIQLAERLRGLSLNARRPVAGSLQGAHRSPHFGASVEFAEYREYSPGDPPQLIDWSVYARSDRYMIRRFHEETNLRAVICLDTSASLSFQGSGAAPKMEYAARLAAGLMFILVNQGDTVGLATFDRRLNVRFAPTGTQEGLRPLLLALETLAPAGDSDIESALHQAAEAFHARSQLIIISDLLARPEGILRGVRHLHHNGHDLIVLHVLDETELHLPLQGLVEFRELETGGKMIVATDEIRDAYRRAVTDHIEALRRGCVDCRADYHLLRTAVPLDELLFMGITRR